MSDGKVVYTSERAGEPSPPAPPRPSLPPSPGEGESAPVLLAAAVPPQTPRLRRRHLRRPGDGEEHGLRRLVPGERAGGDAGRDAAGLPRARSRGSARSAPSRRRSTPTATPWRRRRSRTAGWPWCAAASRRTRSPARPPRPSHRAELDAPGRITALVIDPRAEEPLRRHGRRRPALVDARRTASRATCTPPTRERRSPPSTCCSAAARSPWGRRTARSPSGSRSTSPATRCGWRAPTSSPASPAPSAGSPRRSATAASSPPARAELGLYFSTADRTLWTGAAPVARRLGALLHPEGGRRLPRRRRAGGGGRHPQPAPGGHGAVAVRQGLVRGVRPARLGLAVERRLGRLRAQALAHPAARRHAQGDLLLAAAGDPARRLRARCTSRSSCTRRTSATSSR